MSREPSSAVLVPGVRVPARALFLGGALLYPPFLLQPDIVIRAGIIVAFMVLCGLAGRRVRVVQTLLVTAGIVAFNLVIPTGRVLAAPLGLPITEAALKTGLMKATAMTGLVFLSQFSIRTSLQLPGRIGGLVGRMLYYFGAIMSQRGRIDRRNLVGSLDAILLSLAAPADDGGQEAPGQEGRGEDSPACGPVSPRGPAQAGLSVRGAALLIAIVAVNWAVYVATLVHPRPFWGG